MKDKPYRVRIIVGRDKLDYTEDMGLPVANLLEIKILINSMISNAKCRARFIYADIKDYFLTIVMKDLEYMRIKYQYIPYDIRKRYHLDQKLTQNRFLYIKIQKGMLGLKQATILAYKHLKNCLEPFRYKPILGTIDL